MCIDRTNPNERAIECGLLYLDGAGRFLCWIGFEKYIFRLPSMIVG